VDRLKSKVMNLLRKTHEDAGHTNAISINSDEAADTMSLCILLLGQAIICRQ